MTKSAVCLLIAVASCSGGSVAVPKLEVRLQTHLTTYASPVGTRFRCVVIRQYSLDGRVVIPRGSTVYGGVSKRRSVGIGLIHERATLELSFDEYETPDGRRFPLSARLASIDNAREEVNGKGQIRGVLAANHPGNLLNGVWMKPSFNLFFRSLAGLTGAANQVWARYSMGPAGIAGMFAMRCFILPFPEPEIHLPPGTDMKLKIRAPLEGTSDPPAVDFRELETHLPQWLETRVGSITYAGGEEAPDRINVILAGSQPEIRSSFAGAGWYHADPRSWRASSRMYQAFSLMRGYASAPVSRLYLRGAEPDLVFEKSLNTVSQRHHIRLWQAGSFEGVEIWLGAATHDTGVGFKLDRLSFTHKIEKDIDVERDKVITDLTFAGCSEAPAFFDGSDRPDSAAAAAVATDGRLAVLVSHPCAAYFETSEPPGRPGNKVTRLARRVVLEARNYLLRDNAYYWGYWLLSRKSRSNSISE